MTSRPDELPGVELDPIPQHDGRIGPYADSQLRSITTSRVRPRPWRWWYSQRRELLASMQAPVVTAAHPQLDAWLKLVDGLDHRLRISQPPVSQWPISRVVPRIIPSKQGIPFEVPVGTYWVDYGNVSVSMKNLPERDWTLRLTEQFPEGSRVLLGFIGEHLLSRMLWQQRFALWRHPFFEQFREHGIICPDFSSWLTDPRPQVMVADRMVSQFTELGHQHGYNMIPLITWQDRDMLRRQVDTLGSLYPKVNTVYVYLISTGVDKTSWLWSRLDDMAEHLAHLPFRFLISGTEAGWAINALSDVFPRGNFNVVAMQPYMYATKVFASQDDRARIFRERVARVEGFLNGENLPPLRPRPADPWAEVMGDDASPQIS